MYIWKQLLVGLFACPVDEEESIDTVCELSLRHRAFGAAVQEPFGSPVGDGRGPTREGAGGTPEGP